ncbi:uncharacterized protein LOC127734203 [Mytilus californianus]|uniref:uncharacterized protein LOC127734203 n=1 Tax=Mytilus californianus TaxID=6549 RepID=UPI0022482BDE|nr:uncharacterized protein LOC127734203 [Mytilus californianus]
MDVETREDPLKIIVKCKVIDKNEITAVIARWKWLIEEKLMTYVIDGNSENTIDHVNQAITVCKIKNDVLALQSVKNSRFVRLFSKKQQYIDMVRNAYENPVNPLAEHHEYSRDPELKRRSQRAGTYEGAGSFRRVDYNVGLDQNDKIKFKFETDEGLLVKLYKKPITKLQVDAIVNAANESLANVGGVADVIAKAAGSRLSRECKDSVAKNGKILDGANVVTSAGNLQYRAVIHAVGPRWHDYRDKKNCLEVLMTTVINILNRSCSKNYESVAMPPISSGIFGVPKSMCAAMYLKGIFEFSKQGRHGTLKEFHIIDINDDVLDLVYDWYMRFQNNQRCLDFDIVLAKSADANLDHPGNRRFGGNGHTGHYQKPDNRHSGSHGNSDNFASSWKSINKPEGNKRYDHNGREIGALKGTGSTPITGKVIRSFCGKTDIHIYTDDILKLKNMDAVVVSEDGLVKGEGGLSRALLDAGCNTYRDEHRKLQPWVMEKSRATVLMTSGGKNLPFKHVLHAILRRKPNEKEEIFQKELSTTINNILEKANILDNRMKKGVSIVLPMIGLGTKPNEDIISNCCWTLIEAVKKFLRKCKNIRIREIHLVNNSDVVTEDLQKKFTVRSFSAKPPPPTKRPYSSRPDDHDKYTPSKSMTKYDTWRFDTLADTQQDVTRFMVKHVKTSKQKGNLNILNDDDVPDEDQPCVVCLCEMDDPVELKECKHAFCRQCIMEVFGAKPSCPVCGTLYGKVYGDQPRNGIANIYIDEESLPGYDRKRTWVVYYDFPDGKQESFHPEQGKPYEGIKRRAFLPYNDEGTEVLKLLKKAFQQGLTFTIGTSRTTGKEGVLTWNDIHHKTSRTGGSQKFGYPDPEYLMRVKDELASKGVTSDK